MNYLRSWGEKRFTFYFRLRYCKRPFGVSLSRGARHVFDVRNILNACLLEKHVERGGVKSFLPLGGSVWMSRGFFFFTFQFCGAPSGLRKRCMRF